MDSRNTHIPPPWCILTHMHTCPHLNLTLPTNLISGMSHNEPSSDTRAQCDSCAPPSSRSSPSNSWGTRSGFSSPRAASLKVAPRRRMERWRTLPVQCITLQTCSGSVCEGLARVSKCLHACVSLDEAQHATKAWEPHKKYEKMLWACSSGPGCRQQRLFSCIP